MAYQVNLAAFDRGAQMVSDLQREERQAMLDKKQEERDARDLEKYKREVSEYNDAKDASQKLVDSIRSQQPSTVGDLFSRYAPQPTAGQSTSAPSPSDNPVANNVTTEPAGSFSGDPRAVLSGIQSIRDPAERARAAQAFQSQLNNPGRNTELLRQNGSIPGSTQGTQVRVQPVQIAAPDGGQPGSAQSPVTKMEAAQPQPFKLAPEVMARRNALVAEAEMMAKTNRQALPGVVEKIRKFDLGVGAYEIRHNVINMDEGRFSELVKRADVNPNFEAKLSGVPGGATELSMGDKKIRLNRNQAADWLTGIYLMEKGDFEGGRSIISGISKELADASIKYADYAFKLKNDQRDDERLKLLKNSDVRAAESAARTAASDARKFSEEVAKRGANFSLFKERNPHATPVELEAMARGVPVEKSGAYKVEMGDVTAAFGTPAVDAEGKPQADLLTGRQVINRNPKEEAVFFKWMADNGITDTNKGLAIYLGQKQSGTAPGGQSSSAGAAGPAPKISTKEDFDRLPAGARFTAPDGTVRVKQ